MTEIPWPERAAALRAGRAEVAAEIERLIADEPEGADPALDAELGLARTALRNLRGEIEALRTERAENAADGRPTGVHDDLIRRLEAAEAAQRHAAQALAAQRDRRVRAMQRRLALRRQRKHARPERIVEKIVYQDRPGPERVVEKIVEKIVPGTGAPLAPWQQAAILYAEAARLQEKVQRLGSRLSRAEQNEISDRVFALTVEAQRLREQSAPFDAYRRPGPGTARAYAKDAAMFMRQGDCKLAAHHLKDAWEAAGARPSRAVRARLTKLGKQITKKCRIRRGR